MPLIDQFVGEIRAVGFDFAPSGWVPCDGRLLFIAENVQLYSLLGTRFGGDGQSTFGVPDLRGRSAVGVGQGAGLSPIVVGEAVGLESTNVLVSNLPSHAHQAAFTNGGARPAAYSGGGSTTDPTGAVPANAITDTGAAQASFASLSLANTGMAPVPVEGQVTVLPTGNGAPLYVRSPGLGLSYIISIEGTFPSQG